MKRFKIDVTIFDKGSASKEIADNNFDGAIVGVAKSIYHEIESYRPFDKNAICMISGRYKANFPFGERISADFGWTRLEGCGYFNEKLPGYYTVTIINE